MSDIMKLKSGDLIPIADPTDVFLCLNELKLFRASAGQANNKRVVNNHKRLWRGCGSRNT